jgi:hypothetical protein
MFPVALFAYNRPNTLAKTLARLAGANLTKLYIFADGPKQDNPTDVLKCSKVRNILDKLYWPCEIIRTYNSTNRGLKKQIEEQLTFLFSCEDAAIILEDDCLPESDFFRFCEAGLQAYTESPRVMAITGNQYMEKQSRPFFSRFPHCWGWATWRRAWQAYDANISGWPEFKRSSHWQSEFLPEEKKYWEPLLDRVYGGELNSWAYRWLATVWMYDGLVLTPPVNLVSNIGFGEDGTHCRSDTPLSNYPTEPLSGWSLPQGLDRNARLDRKTFFKVFYNQKLPLFKRWQYGV